MQFQFLTELYPELLGLWVKPNLEGLTPLPWCNEEPRSPKDTYCNEDNHCIHLIGSSGKARRTGWIVNHSSSSPTVLGRCPYHKRSGGGPRLILPMEPISWRCFASAMSMWTDQTVSNTIFSKMVLSCGFHSASSLQTSILDQIPKYFMTFEHLFEDLSASFSSAPHQVAIAGSCVTQEISTRPWPEVDQQRYWGGGFQIWEIPNTRHPRVSILNAFSNST